MKIAILSIGSEGDVRPYIALGRELQSKEHSSPPHEVHLITHASAKARVEAAGLGFADIGKDPVDELSNSELGKAVAEASPFTKMSAVKTFFTRLIEDWFKNGHEALKAMRPNFVVLGTFPMNIHSLLCSNVLSIPFCQIHLMPIISTSEHAPPVGFGEGQCYFKFMAKLKWIASFKLGYSLLYSAPLSKLYTPLGVSISSSKVSEKWATTPAVLGYSTVLSPRPSDYDQEKVKIVGPIMDKHSEEEVAKFVETEDGRKLTRYFARKSTSEQKPTVFVGFGSMWDTLTDNEKQKLQKEIIASAKTLENDVHGFIVQCDGASMSGDLEVPTNFISIKGAPHSWLFPQVDIVVCHGGAGTTHKAILHNCAAIVCPCKVEDSDQPFWGGCVARAGVGVHGPNMKSLTASKLTNCIKQVSNSNTNANVKEASEKAKKQDGVKNGAKAVLHFARLHSCR